MSEQESPASTGRPDTVVRGQSASDESVREATGRTREEWHRVLNDAGAQRWKHAAIARWLIEEHGVPGWWAQGITVGYEHARGTRLPGQQADGSFAVGASRTVRATKAAGCRRSSRRSVPTSVTRCR